MNARREVELHDGIRAAAGDTVITRRNDRRLRAGRSWVRNGDRWTVTEVRDDGAITLRRAGRKWGGSVVVPAEYAAEHLDLGYAVTSYRAQGITVDSSHVLADASMTRETFYVAMTRGCEHNIAYVAVDRPDPAHDGPHPGDSEDASARSVLFGVLQHVGTELSAQETITAEQHAWGSIAQLAAECETLAAAAQHDRWAALIRSSGLSDDDAQMRRSHHPRSEHWPLSRGGQRRTSTTWRPCCRASWEHAGSGTATTSPQFCTTASRRQLRG